MRGLVAGSICIFIHSMITIIYYSCLGGIGQRKIYTFNEQKFITFPPLWVITINWKKELHRASNSINSMEFLTPKELWGLERSSPKSSTKSLLCPRAICIGGSYQIPGAALTTTTTDHSIAYAHIFTENQMLWPTQEFHSQKGFQLRWFVGSVGAIRRWILGKYVAH